MITPIGLRQVLQMAAAEAVRGAQGGSEQVQRELARRQFLDQRVAEDQGAVHQVPSTENLRLEEQPREQAKEQKPRQRGAPKTTPSAQPDDAEAGQAGTADPHLDFLA